MDDGFDHLEGKEIKAACCGFLSADRRADPTRCCCCFQLLYDGFASLKKN